MTAMSGIVNGKECSRVVPSYKCSPSHADGVVSTFDDVKTHFIKSKVYQSLARPMNFLTQEVILPIGCCRIMAIFIL